MSKELMWEIHYTRRNFQSQLSVAKLGLKGQRETMTRAYSLICKEECVSVSWRKLMHLNPKRCTFGPHVLIFVHHCLKLTCSESVRKVRRACECFVVDRLKIRENEMTDSKIRGDEGGMHLSLSL